MLLSAAPARETRFGRVCQGHLPVCTGRGAASRVRPSRLLSCFRRHLRKQERWRLAPNERLFSKTYGSWAWRLGGDSDGGDSDGGDSDGGDSPSPLNDCCQNALCPARLLYEPVSLLTRSLAPLSLARSLALPPFLSPSPVYACRRPRGAGSIGSAGPHGSGIGLPLFSSLSLSVSLSLFLSLARSLSLSLTLSFSFSLFSLVHDSWKLFPPLSFSFSLFLSLFLSLLFTIRGNQGFLPDRLTRPSQPSHLPP